MVVLSAGRREASTTERARGAQDLTFIFFPAPAAVADAAGGAAGTISTGITRADPSAPLADAVAPSDEAVGATAGETFAVVLAEAAAAAAAAVRWLDDAAVERKPSPVGMVERPAAAVARRSKDPPTLLPFNPYATPAEEGAREADTCRPGLDRSREGWRCTGGDEEGRRAAVVPELFVSPCPLCALRWSAINGRYHGTGNKQVNGVRGEFTFDISYVRPK
eukprot:g15782.t1